MFKYTSCYFFVLEVELDRASTSRFVGEVSVSLYDVKGSICDDTWNDAAAQVVCREMGFVSGNATRGTVPKRYPILASGVNCTGNEKSLSECQMKPFNETNNCRDSSSRAAFICSKKKGNFLVIEVLFIIIT